jgi:hypothetical protein
MKGLDDPTNLTECGSREELKQLGEGQRIKVVAWALTAKSGSPESCNCDLPHQVDLDNHIVLIDPRVKNPTLAKDEKPFRNGRIYSACTVRPSELHQK